MGEKNLGVRHDIMNSSQEKGTGETSEDVWIPAICEQNCIMSPCLLRVNVVNGVAVGIEPNTTGDGFKELSRSLGTLCPKAYGLIQKLYNSYRIKGPMKRTNPEKGRGVDPKWISISWDEALDIIAEKLKKIRAEDTRKLAQGGPGVQAIHASEVWELFFRAFGPTQLLISGESDKCYLGEHQWGNRIHGAGMCEVDVKYCNYLILMGINQVASRGAIEALRYADARERGMKIVAIDPACTTTVAKANEWIPIKPGTDTAFLLAMIDIIINEIGIYDKEFLKEMTNSPYLVKPDGYFMRDKATGKVLVWDPIDQQPRIFDDAAIKDFALEGTFLIEGVECRPAFQMLKDHVRQYTAEWAESVTDIDAATIRRITREFVENARVGSTINIEGLTLPYRPANIQIGKGVEGTTHQYSAVLANHIIAALIGSIEVPGGHQGGINGPRPRNKDGIIFHMDPHMAGMKPGEDGMPKIQATPFTWPPVSHGATEALVPFTLCGLFIEDQIEDPSLLRTGQMRHAEWANFANSQKKLSELPLPEVWIRYRCNPLLQIGEPEVVAKVLEKIPFIISFAYTEDEITDYADILLPESIEFEKYLIMFRTRLATSRVIYQISLQQPVVKPIHNTMDINDVLFELADRIGFLDELNANLSISLDLADPYKMESGKKYTWEEVVDRQCKSYTSGAYDLEWFKKNGALVGKVPVEEDFEIHLTMKEQKLRYPIPYMEKVKREGEQLARNLAEHGIDWWPTEEYVPLPVYYPSILDSVPPEYDLYIVNTRAITDSWGNNYLPWISEIGKHIQGYADILMHEDTAKARGIKNGDKIWVESPVGKVKNKVKLTQGIRPDCLLVTGMGGQWKMPVGKDDGRSSLSVLTPMNYEWTDKVTGAMQGTALKCRVYKA